MFGQIFSAIGGAIGSSFGGGILSTIGRFAGKMLGDYLEDIDYDPPPLPEPKEPQLRIRDFRFRGFDLVSDEGSK